MWLFKDNRNTKLQFWRSEALKGDTSSQLELGKALIEDNKRDEAVHWLTAASLGGNMSAKVSLAATLLGQAGKEPEIFSLLNQACDQNNADAYFLLGSICFGGVISPEYVDKEKAYTYIFKAAELGHKRALFMLGQAFENGNQNFVPSEDINYQEAIKWYTLSSTPQALHHIGRIYEKGGYGVDSDYVKAFEWYSSAADLGQETSICRLAKCYLYGELNVSIQHRLGHKLLDSLIKKGDVDALKEKAICYWEGIGTSKNLHKAFQLLESAGYNGSLGAMTILASCYESGDVLIRKGNRLSYGKEAQQWYTLALLTGFYPDAAEKIEFYGEPDYSNGFGEFLIGFTNDFGRPGGSTPVVPNKLEAIKYYRMALKKGFTPAKERLLAIDSEYKKRCDRHLTLVYSGGGLLIIGLIGYALVKALHRK